MPEETFDKPWKIALENFFPDFMHFFFPNAARQIDWQQGHEFLDTQLEKVAGDSETSHACVDKLVKVFRHDDRVARIFQTPSAPDMSGRQRRVYSYTPTAA